MGKNGGMHNSFVRDTKGKERKIEEEEWFVAGYRINEFCTGEIVIFCFFQGVK